jgi:hypothetical protein
MLARCLGWFVLAIVVAVGLLGCTPHRLVSAADLQRYGTRPFKEPKAEVVRATATALRTLGYEVTVADEATGKVKTSPKVVVIGAVRTSTYTAVGYQNAIAWTIDVTPGSDGSTLVRATPRAYLNGQEDTRDRWDADYMEQSIDTVFREIASDLPATAAPTEGVAAKAKPEPKTAAPANDRRRAKTPTK